MKVRCSLMLSSLSYAEDSSSSSPLPLSASTLLSQAFILCVTFVVMVFSVIPRSSFFLQPRLHLSPQPISIHRQQRLWRTTCKSQTHIHRGILWSPSCQSSRSRNSWCHGHGFPPYRFVLNIFKNGRIAPSCCWFKAERGGKTGVIFPKHKIIWLWLRDYTYYCDLVHIYFFMIRYNCVLKSILVWIAFVSYFVSFIFFARIWADWICVYLSYIIWSNMCSIFSFSNFSFSPVPVMIVCSSWMVVVEVVT